MSTSTPSPKRPFFARDTPPLIPAADFNPAPSLTEQILSDINDNDIALSTIAEKANTSIESLTLWLTRPEIDARLNAMESVFARRCRLQLANRTGSIMTACSTCIDQFNHAQSHLLFESNDLRAHTVLNRKASNALLASRILLHLAKHFSNPISPRPTRPQSPAPTPPAPTPVTPDNTDHPNSTHTSRFTVLPPLPDLLNLYDLRSTNNTTPNTPTRDNVHTEPPRSRAGHTGLASTSASPTATHVSTFSDARETGDATNERTSPPCACPTKSCSSNPSHPCSSVANPASTLITIAGRTATRSPRARDPTKSQR